MDELQIQATPEPTLGASRQKKALIIAIRKTSDPKLGELGCPHRDAKNIGQLLIGKHLSCFFAHTPIRYSLEVYGYNAGNVVTLLDADDEDSRLNSNQPTRTNMVSLLIMWVSSGVIVRNQFY